MSAKDLAYGGNGNGGTENATYRMERGFAYTRGGKIVAPIPQFKGLYLYSQAAGGVPKTFKQTMTSTRVRWPVPPGPTPNSFGNQVPSGS